MHFFSIKSSCKRSHSLGFYQQSGHIFDEMHILEVPSYKLLENCDLLEL